MTVRKCQTCKHYQASPIRRKGWCRNPKLYSPQQNHLVGQDDLDCSRGLDHFWEPIEATAKRPPESVAAVGDPVGSAAPTRRFFAPPGRLAAASATMVTSSGGAGAGSGSGSGSGGGSSGSGSGGGRTGGSAPYPGPPRPERTGPPPGQERTVSYQPEERYWTDYLRIALPVVGLLLMLGLFWFWANSLIGDDDSDNQPTPTANVALNETPVTAPTNTPPATTAANINPTPGSDRPSPTPEGGNEEEQQAEPTPTEEVEEEPETSAETVITTTEVNMRAEPDENSDVVVLEPEGTELEVTGEASAGETYTWLPVRDADGNEGWVAEDFVTSSEE